MLLNFLGSIYTNNKCLEHRDDNNLLTLPIYNRSFLIKISLTCHIFLIGLSSEALTVHQFQIHKIIHFKKLATQWLLKLKLVKLGCCETETVARTRIIQYNLGVPPTPHISFLIPSVRHHFNPSYTGSRYIRKADFSLSMNDQSILYIISCINPCSQKVR